MRMLTEVNYPTLLRRPEITKDSKKRIKKVEKIKMSRNADHEIENRRSIAELLRHEEEHSVRYSFSECRTRLCSVTETVSELMLSEANSISNAAKKLDQSAEDLVNMILSTKGFIFITGIGKSAIIAKKMASTMASFGITSVFLPPLDAIHGELGLVKEGDMILIISKSGSGKEFELIVKNAKELAVKSALISCAKGPISKIVDLQVQLKFDREICPLGLAPTSSSTMILAFCDAVAVTVATATGIDKKGFLRNHPGGKIGKKLRRECSK